MNTFAEVQESINRCSEKMRGYKDQQAGIEHKDQGKQYNDGYSLGHECDVIAEKQTHFDVWGRA